MELPFPSFQNHASQDIVEAEGKLITLLGVENDMEELWADYPWDM